MEALKEILKEYNTTKQKVSKINDFIMSEKFDELDKMSKLLIVQKYDSLYNYEKALKTILIHNNALN